MKYIFLDESGDLGFKDGSSNYFILTALITKYPRKIEKIVKKVKRKIKSKKIRRKTSELHAYRANQDIRNKVFNCLSKEDNIEIVILVLNKKSEKLKFKIKKEDFSYGILSKIILKNIIEDAPKNSNEMFEICFDQRDTKKNARENFKKYILQEMEEEKRNKIKLLIKTSHGEKCLQIADFISWAIFRKKELKNGFYFEMIKSKITKKIFLP